MASDQTRGAIPILDVTELRISFPSRHGPQEVVAGLNFKLMPGRTLGLVGESGCGKSMSALALLGLVPKPGRVSGSIRFAGREMLGQAPSQWRNIRGNRVAIIFQEPMSAFNPVMRVGYQIAEAIVLHQHCGWKLAAARAIELLAEVRIARPQQCAASYPHQLSGGMLQRAMIAMAISCSPSLLIADEPTTALDVTVQAQILDLLLDLQQKTRMAMLFISHNLAVVSEVSHDVAVMYAGRILEHGPTQTLLSRPMHPYSRALIEAVPDLQSKARPVSVSHDVPDRLQDTVSGCSFINRCAENETHCHTAEPLLEESSSGHFVACFRSSA